MFSPEKHQEKMSSWDCDCTYHWICPFCRGLQEDPNGWCPFLPGTFKACMWHVNMFLAQRKQEELPISIKLLNLSREFYNNGTIVPMNEHCVGGMCKPCTRLYADMDGKQVDVLEFLRCSRSDKEQINNLLASMYGQCCNRNHFNPMASHEKSCAVREFYARMFRVQKHI